MDKPEAAYRYTLAQHLQAYATGEPYGRCVQRPCGHWSWEIVLPFPCIGCATSCFDAQLSMLDVPPSAKRFTEVYGAWRSTAESA